MRETVRSLRIYFGLSGVFSVLRGTRPLLTGDLVVGVLVIGLGIAYLYLMARLPRLLDQSLATVKWVLVTASTLLGVGLLLAFVNRNTYVGVVCALGLVINWYLFRNARRLAVERRVPNPAAIPTP
jgi:hypothetical protein